MNDYHIPVMIKEAINLLNVEKNSWYIDCNLGGGGHTKEILNLGGKVIGIDLDFDAINKVSKEYASEIKSGDLVLHQTNFSNIKQVFERVDEQPLIKGVLFDLGVSSYQLEKSERGFSFNTESPLDMRMDQNAQIPTAADLVNALHERELAELFWKFGEERFAKKIAKKIVEERKKSLIKTTCQLAQIVSSCVRKSKNDKTHPATRVFQALRILVNDELNSLSQALPQAFELLNPGGRVVVISFHSLEDRIVKNYYKELDQNKKGVILTKKPIEVSDKEVEINPRSRSAKLRAIQKA